MWDLFFNSSQEETSLPFCFILFYGGAKTQHQVFRLLRSLQVKSKIKSNPPHPRFNLLQSAYGIANVKALAPPFPSPYVSAKQMQLSL